MYIIYTFVHFAILLIRQVFRAVPLPVTISFVVEALSFTLGSSFGLFHLSSNLLAVLLEVPLSSLCPFLETSDLCQPSTLDAFLDFYLRRFQHREELRNRFMSSLAYYSSSLSSSYLVIVTREFCQSLFYLED